MAKEGNKQERNSALKRNFSRMFWIRLFFDVRFLHVVSVLFYLHRGLTLEEVFYLAIVWSVVSLISEVPSSYMADKWGRKKTLILGTLFVNLHWIIYFFAWDFVWFAVGVGLVSLSYSFFSGTDEALIYDTGRELKKEGKSLKRFGKYYSARHLAKVFTPVIGALIARNLLEWQFQTLIILDLIATMVSLVIAFRIVEPKHFYKVEKQEAGIILDAINIIRANWVFVKAILSRVLIFIATFIAWRYHQKFFVDINISILTIGIMYGVTQLCGFIFNQKAHLFLPKVTLRKKINVFNGIVTFFIFLFVMCYFFFFNNYLLLIFYSAFVFFELARWPMYSEWFNKNIKSYNRATTLSLANFLKGVLDIPILFLGAYLIGMGMIYPYILSLALAVVVVLFFRLPKKVEKGAKV
ncbi:MFS transporter [Patescibacteria group bacterium]|nr:MFS transporter [Patescibacteria group bacterium]